MLMNFTAACFKDLVWWKVDWDYIKLIHQAQYKFLIFYLYIHFFFFFL